LHPSPFVLTKPVCEARAGLWNLDEIGEALPALKAAGRGAYCATLFIGDAVVKKLALLLISAVALSGCQSLLVSHKEALLESSGFKATPADTPERQAMLTSLPARQVVAGGYDTYVYADPLVCDCLYIGSYAAYSKYQDAVSAAARSTNGLGSGMNTSNNTAFDNPQALH